MLFKEQKGSVEPGIVVAKGRVHLHAVGERKIEVLAVAEHVQERASGSQQLIPVVCNEVDETFSDCLICGLDDSMEMTAGHSFGCREANVEILVGIHKGVDLGCYEVFHNNTSFVNLIILCYIRSSLLTVFIARQIKHHTSMMYYILIILIETELN